MLVAWLVAALVVLLLGGGKGEVLRSHDLECGRKTVVG